jgi:hypothetical protein
VIMLLRRERQRLGPQLPVIPRCNPTHASFPNRNNICFPRAHDPLNRFPRTAAASARVSTPRNTRVAGCISTRATRFPSPASHCRR